MTENEYLIRQGFYYKGKCEAYGEVMRSLGIVEPQKLYKITRPNEEENEN